MKLAPHLRLDSVSWKAGRTPIITDVDLLVRPGQLTALIGPSGSGKTTVLKCLSALLKPSRGAVTADGAPIWDSRRAYRSRFGYVPQDDVVHAALTVRQALAYSARLRLDDGMPPDMLERRVGSVAKLLGLDERLSVRIRRLSGGQRKRVNIGVELVADPDILVLDEPSSGLDPGTEGDLVKLLKRLAENGRTVVMTTHSMEYLGDYDSVVLLMKGRVVFCGRLPEMLAHFGAPAPAEVFRVLRGADAEDWAARWRASPLSARAVLP
ncbi:MAG: ABC transporter ATP-binding protein [Elusimicrobia bacterium]|nr:ABC transporter ATP-binding protein [Elusimicrobiota bacterium]